MIPRPWTHWVRRRNRRGNHTAFDGARAVVWHAAMTPPFPGFSFQAIAKADLWISLYKCRQGARGPEWPSDYWGGGAGTMHRKFSQVCFTLVKAQPRHHKL